MSKEIPLGISFEYNLEYNSFVVYYNEALANAGDIQFSVAFSCPPGRPESWCYEMEQFLNRYIRPCIEEVIEAIERKDLK